jgi:hypothetical protein
LKPPKKKLKEIFRDLQSDRKLLVAKLKMVCDERCCLLANKMEDVKPFNVIAAMCTHIETLSAQEQMDKLDSAVKEKYSNVFSPIPHIDDLLINVYCRIKT